MPDAITAGALVAAAISAGAATMANGVLGAAAVDAYEALKHAVVRWTGDGGDLAKLEAKPDSQARSGVLAELVDEQPQEAQQDLAALGQALIAALREAERERGPIGIDIGKLEAMQVELERIRVTEGIGVKIGEVETPGTFRAGDINVGSTSRKTWRLRALRPNP